MPQKHATRILVALWVEAVEDDIILKAPSGLLLYFSLSQALFFSSFYPRHYYSIFLLWLNLVQHNTTHCVETVSLNILALRAQG